MTSRPAQHEVVVRKNVMIAMHDGVRLAADLYVPSGDKGEKAGALPTLLARTPYNKNGVEHEGRYFAERGFVVVANDVRGRYSSEGTWRLIADDPQDGFEVVEWIANQEWSDGKIGTFGTSYPGGTQHALAEMNPPHLTTMIPIDSLSNCGVSGMRHGGAFELRFMNWIFQIGAPNSRAARQPGLQQAGGKRPANPRPRRQPTRQARARRRCASCRNMKRGWSRRCAADRKRRSGTRRACR